MTTTTETTSEEAPAAGVPTADQQAATANNMLAISRLLKVGLYHGEHALQVADSIRWLEAMYVQMAPAKATPLKIVKATEKRARKAAKKTNG